MPVPAYVSISSAQDSLGNVHHGPDFFLMIRLRILQVFTRLRHPRGITTSELRVMDSSLNGCIILKQYLIYLLTLLLLR